MVGSQSWALEVFLNFFNKKNRLYVIFDQVKNLFMRQSYSKKPTPSQINLI